MTTPAQAGKWYHLAATWDGATRIFYVDGIVQHTAADVDPVESVGNPLLIGKGDEGLHFQGLIDEVLIHNVAKSPDYIYHRARPGVPKVRFLANTVVENQGTEEAPAYPLRGYRMYWGDDDATAAMPFVSSLADAPAVVPDTCYGLLNGCHGYAGWWRFNGGSGTVAVDSGTGKHTGTILGGAEFLAGRNGTALSLLTEDQEVVVPYSPALTGLPMLTIESMVMPDNWSTDELDANVILSSEASGTNSYRLHLRNSEYRGMVQSGLPGAVLDSDISVVQEWRHVGLLYDGAEASVLIEHGAFGTEPNTGTLKNAQGDIYIGDNFKESEAFDFFGLIDDVRVSNRALTTDEFLHFPLVEWAWEAVDCVSACADGQFCSNGLCVSDEQAGMVAIPAGDFRMGCNEAVDDGCDDNEKPYHLVTTPGYLIDLGEVSVGEYKACVNDDICSGPVDLQYKNNWAADMDSYPVNGVSKTQAAVYCEWAGLRLCSEAEWEKAASGGCEFYDDCEADSPRYPWGNNDCKCHIAWTASEGASSWDCNNDVWSMPVDSMPLGVSPYGVLNMAGNVSEWVEDCYHATYAGAPTDGSAWDGVCADAIVRKGGSFGTGAHWARVSYRETYAQGLGFYSTGFRCCGNL